jgi:sensor histidine kinase regulating citrate/malate metabolism
VRPVGCGPLEDLEDSARSTGDNVGTHGRGTITVSVREAAGAVGIDFADQGADVQDPDGAFIAPRADRPDGHGIGLALARHLAEAEQGRLELTRTTPPVFTVLLR